MAATAASAAVVGKQFKLTDSVITFKFNFKNKTNMFQRSSCKVVLIVSDFDCKQNGPLLKQKCCNCSTSYFEVVHVLTTGCNLLLTVICKLLRN